MCRCEAVPCGNGSQLLHEGECRDPLGSGVCGGRLGARLYLGEDGRAECGCLEVSSQQPGAACSGLGVQGWVQVGGVCHQEFAPSPALCPDPDTILRLKPAVLLFPGVNNVIKVKRLKFTKRTCVKNPCQSSSLLPHR